MLSERALTIARMLSGAAKIALEYYPDCRPELKEDHTVVTAADRAVEEFLTSRLENEAEGIRVIGEETFARKSGEYLDAACKGKTWIIDPIDGTVMYARHIPVWGNILGYAENGVILDGGFTIPETGEMLLSDQGKAYYGKSSRPYGEWDFEKELKVMTPPDSAFDERSLVVISQEAAHRALVRAPNSLVALNSTCFMALLLAAGRASAAFHHAKLWDYAGTLPVLKALGFTAGENPVFNMSIGEENYNHDYRSLNAFCVRETVLTARDEKVIPYLKRAIEFPEGRKNG